jgi:hypothetical protein
VRIGVVEGWTVGEEAIEHEVCGSFNFILFWIIVILMIFFNLLADAITNADESCTGGTLCNQWSLFQKLVIFV